MNLRQLKTSSFAITLFVGALVVWMLGVLVPPLMPTSPHEMIGHVMKPASQGVDTCQIACALVPLQAPQRTAGIGRFITRPEPLNLNYRLLLVVILIPLAVRIRRLFLLVSWRPPDIPLLTHKYSVSL